MQDIDFSALPAGRGTPKKPRSLAIKIIRVLITLILAVPIGFVVVLGTVFIIWWSIKISPMATAALFIILILLAFYLVLRQTARKNQLARKFALANGWRSKVPSPVNPILQNAGYVFPDAMVAGQLEGNNFWIQTVGTPMIRRNGNELDSFDSLVIEVPLPLPTLMVVPTANRASLTPDRLAYGWFGMAPLHLEGDFDKIARTYYKPGDEVDALEYLTPDVMGVIADNFQSTLLYADRYIYLLPQPQLEQQADELSIPPGLFSRPVMMSLFSDGHKILREILEKQRP